jgi:8-oxo-dGTP diphosphatase
VKNIDKLAWIELKDKAILSTKSYGKDKYYIPGGKREAGESDQEALCREIKEELNVDLEVNTIQYLGNFQAQAHGHPEGVMVTMSCYTAAYSGNLQPSAEIEEMRWMTYADIDEVSQVDVLIFEHLKEQFLLR